MHCVQRDLFLLPVVADYKRGLCRHVEEGADCFAGALAGAEFHELTQKHQCHDHGRGFEVDADMALRVAEAVGEDAGYQDGDHAVKPGGHHSHRNQREHVEIHRAERGPTTREEGQAAPQHHRRAQYQLGPERPAFAEGRAQASETEKRRHREDQEGDRQQGSDLEPPGEIRQLRVPIFLGHRGGCKLQTHAADRAGTGLCLAHARMHRADVDRACVAGRN